MKNTFCTNLRVCWTLLAIGVRRGAEWRKCPYLNSAKKTVFEKTSKIEDIQSKRKSHFSRTIMPKKLRTFDWEKLFFEDNFSKKSTTFNWSKKTVFQGQMYRKIEDILLKKRRFLRTGFRKIRGHSIGAKKSFLKNN